jgi:hypothetical protein
MSWYDDRPAPSRPEALEKVFELARIPFGMMVPENATDWIEWLNKVRIFVTHSRRTESRVEAETRIRDEMARICARMTERARLEFLSETLQEISNEVSKSTRGSK